MTQVLSPGAVPELMAPPIKEEEWRENLNVKLICKDCREDPPDLYEDHASGDLVCASCGLVLQQRTIDQSSEWRTFNNDDQGTDDPSRVGDGPNPLLNGSQLSTGIAFGEGGMRGKELSRAQDKSNLDKGNKILLQAYKQIGAYCDGWQLPGSVSDTAKLLYKDADESRAFKGKSVEAVIAGCIFLACRRNNVPRSFREVTTLTRVSKKEIGRTFKMLEKILQQREKEKTAEGAPASGEAYKGSGTANPAELCRRYCNNLQMSQRATHLAEALATKTTTTGALAGRSPLSAAAACIYMAGLLLGELQNIKDIQDAAGVSDSTIRQAYKFLYVERAKIIDEDMKMRGADPTKLPVPS